jgi:hypothetical protein
MALVKFAITQEDLDDGDRFNASSCPVALCSGRTLKRNDISVGCFSTFIGEGKERKQVSMPREMQDYIKNFDRRIEVRPVEFEMEIPDEFLPKE